MQYYKKEGMPTRQLVANVCAVCGNHLHDEELDKLKHQEQVEREMRTRDNMPAAHYQFVHPYGQYSQLQPYDPLYVPQGPNPATTAFTEAFESEKSYKLSCGHTSASNFLAFLPFCLLAFLPF